MEAQASSIGFLPVMAVGVKNTILASALIVICALVTGYKAGKHISEIEKTEITVSIRPIARGLNNGSLLTAVVAYLSYNIAFNAVLAYSNS